MATRFMFCITALLCLINSNLAAPPLQPPSSSTADISLTLPLNSSSLTLPLSNASALGNSSANAGYIQPLYHYPLALTDPLSGSPLPSYPPPDPLAYRVPNSNIILVFSKIYIQRRRETWVQNAIAAAELDCSRHRNQESEPLDSGITTWNYRSAELKVKPVPESGAFSPHLVWRSWQHAVRGVRDFAQKYEGADGPGTGPRVNFEILLRSASQGVDAQFAIGKGLLGVI